MDNYQAILLSAGYGTRLQPITLDVPKCLVPIRGVPLLEIWLRKLEQSSCKLVVINTHYLANQVTAFLEARLPSGMLVKTSHEEMLLGTACTLLECRNVFDPELPIVMIHADNLMLEDVSLIIDAYKNRPRGCEMTMLTFDTKNPSSCGIVITDEKGVVQEFYEKSRNPPGHIANAAVYCFSASFVALLASEDRSLKDFSKDVIPLFLKRINTYHTTKPFIDIGTLASYKQAQQFQY